MLRYFGYGSNMDPTSLRAKGVRPGRSERAVLRDWELAFDVLHWFRHEGGMGNIRPCPGASVHGVLHVCSSEELARLDVVESYGVGYDRIEVEVRTESGQCHRATTYVGLPEHCDPACQPTDRYLNIVLRGARASGLDVAYIEELARTPRFVPPEPEPFVAPPGTWPTTPLASLSRHPTLTGLAGHVFDMVDARPAHQHLIGLFGGRDMTLFHLRRLDTSDGSETMEQVAADALAPGQRRYLWGYLREYAHEYRYAGALDYG